MYSKHTKVIEEFVHVVFDETNNGPDSSHSFLMFQLSKYVDDEDEGAMGNSNHQCASSNVDQCPNQDHQGQRDDIKTPLETS